MFIKYTEHQKIAADGSGEKGMETVQRNGLGLLTSKRPIGFGQKRRLGVGAYTAVFAVVVSVLLLHGFSAFGQTQSFQRKVSYETSRVKTFAVPCDIETDSLTAYDSVYLESKMPLIRQAEHVIKEGWLTITHNYPQQPLYDKDFDFHIGKSVTDKRGTRLYTSEGEEYAHWGKNDENEIFHYDFDQIDGYGVFNGLFATSIDELYNHLQTEDVSVFRWGQKLSVVKGNDYRWEETIIDFEPLAFEVRLFEDSFCIFSDRTEYLRQNEWVIPVRNKQTYAAELPSGIYYQVMEEETYLSYKVIDENGDVIVNVENTSPLSLMVTLNDTKTLAFVYFSSPIDGSVNAKIVNTTNDIVLEQELHVSGTLLILNIRGLEAGTYTLICTHENAEAQTNFMIEDATNPNTTNIQIVPNPAQNNITVVFPTDVNTYLSVSIADMTGTVRFNQDMFVTDNTLSIDIPFLTAGMYTIYFTNSNGTISAKFMKQ